MGIYAPWRHGLSRATRHYRSLFTLPKGPLTVILRLVVGSLFGLAMSFHPDGFLYGLLWMTLPSLASDIFAFYLARGDSILRLRRIMVLTLFADFLWLCSASVGRLAAVLNLGERALFIMYALGFSSAASLRFVALRAVSTMKTLRTLSATLIHPGLSLAVTWLSYPLAPWAVTYVVASLPLMMASVWAFLSRVDSVAKPVLGYGSLELFRAFVADWVEDEGEPLERVFHRLAVPGETRVGLISFSADAATAAMVIPYVHAGPFKNIGSSRLTTAIEGKLQQAANCPIAVFHGTAGHEKNVATRAETERIVAALEPAVSLGLEDLKATFMVRVTEGKAKVACQRLNNIGLVAVTLAPSSMEDLPEEVGSTIAAYGKALGFDAVFVIDAHNSLRESEAALSDEDIEAVTAAAKRALQAVKEEPLLPATVGAYSLKPTQFTVEQGMGSGGITTIAISVPGQTAAYVTIDGNNMVSNLREKILNRLADLEVSAGEVFTSDTHEVNATITGRGYHAVGEAIDHDALTGLVERSVREALANRKPARMAWKEVKIEGVKFLGGENVGLFTGVTDAAIAEAKRAALTLFPLAITASLALLLTLPA
ncbi:MAG: DUF2070 family protein [Candidatus Bathyarchaeia archaeon]